MPVKPSIVKSLEKKFDLLLAVRSAMSIVPKVSGENEAGLVPEALQVNMDRPGCKDHRDLKETKVLREFRDLRDLKAIKAPKDPRASLVNPSQPLQSWLLPCPWW